MTVVLLIVLTMAGVSFVWAVTTALAGRLVGATVLKVTFFSGPSLRIVRLGEAEVRLGLLPVGSSVRFLDVATVEAACVEALGPRRYDEDDESEEAQHEGWIHLKWALDYRGGRRLLEELPRVARVSTLLVGWVPVFLFAQAVLGLPDAASELGQAVGQIFRFFRDPAYPATALAGVQAELSAGRWPLAAAVIAMKVTAINLLPLPVFAGGKILEEVASGVLRRYLRWPSLLVNLSFGACIVALVYFVERVWKAHPSLQ